MKLKLAKLGAKIAVLYGAASGRRRSRTTGRHSLARMTLYWWTHWFWITVCGVVLIECTPLSSIDSYPGKLSSKLEENGNKSTYLKRAGELPAQQGGPHIGGGNPSGRPGPPFISSLPPVLAATSGGSQASQANPTANSIVPEEASGSAAVIPVPEQQDLDDTFPSGSLAGTDFGPDVLRYTRKESETLAGATTESDPAVSTAAAAASTAATAGGTGRLKKNGTIFSRNDQNITTLKLKNYNRGVEREDLKALPATRIPDRGTRLVDTLMQVAVENSTGTAASSVPEMHQPEPPTDPSSVDVDDSEGTNVTDLSILPAAEDSVASASDDDNGTLPVQPDDDDDADRPTPASVDYNNNNNNNNSSFSTSGSNINSSSERDIPDSHSDSSSNSNSLSSDRRIGKILSSDFRDFVSAAGSNPNASSYISQAIAFSTQNLQEGVDDQDHPLEDDDYRRSSRAQQRLNVGAISGICLASLGLLSGIAAALVILYRRYLYLNKPQALSEPDSSGYIDDSTIRDNSDEMYSLDNDSFLNSLEAMTIQNYWTDNVKHTKL